MLADFLSHDLFNSDCEQWQCQCENSSLEFTKHSLRSFVVNVAQVEVPNRLLPLLRRSAADMLERFEFHTICMVVFATTIYLYNFKSYILLLQKKIYSLCS
ncbi:unnamed protein product [Urochloa humidicola]